MTADFILGPQIPIGNSYFDQTQIARGKIHGEACPASPPPKPLRENFATQAEYDKAVQAWGDGPMNSFILLNYYDHPLTMRVAYERSKDPIFFEYFRKGADSWWKHPTWIDEGRTVIDADNLGTTPKFVGLGGLILRALDGRPEMWPWIVNYTQVHLVTWCKSRINDAQLWYGPREVAFSMQHAAWVAKTLPDSYPNGSAIKAQLIADLENLAVNYTGRLQYPDGSWRDSSEWVDNVFAVLAADAPQGTIQLKVESLPFPLATDQKVVFWNGGITKTTKAQVAGSTVIDIEPSPINRFKGDFLTVDDGTAMAGTMQPFIVGLLICALIDVHQVVVSETVKENVKNQILKSCRHLYSDGPYAKDMIEQRSGRRIRGFHYFYHGGTNLNPKKYEKGSMVAPWIDYEGWWLMSTRQAIGTILPGFAYAYKISGDPYFKTAYDEMYDSAYNGGDGYRGELAGTSKNYNQHCRRVPASLAWIGGTVVDPPLPTPPVPTPPTPPPPVESPSNTRVPPGTQIVDSTGAVWTRATNGTILRNGASTGGAGPQALYCNHVVYALGMDSQWWQWTGTSWTPVGAVDPCAVPTPPVEPPPVEPPVTKPCSITAPTSVTIPRNSSGVIAVQLNDLTGPVVVNVIGSDGQVTVTPLSWNAEPTSVVKQFQVRTKNKRQMREIKFQSGCGIAVVKVNVV